MGGQEKIRNLLPSQICKKNLAKGEDTIQAWLLTVTKYKSELISWALILMSGFLIPSIHCDELDA